MVTCNAQYFLALARNIGYRLNNENNRAEKVEGSYAFRAIFGISPEVCSVVYRISKMREKKILPRHLLWGLALANSYDTESNFASVFNVTRKTFRKRAFEALVACASALPQVVSVLLKDLDCCHSDQSLRLLFQVKWENRLNADKGKTCKVTVDGTDCQIFEPRPFSKQWYSHKFKKAGVRYEVAVCIQTGWIVWINGPYPCGAWPDIKIF